MVGHSHDEVEWEVSADQRSGPHDRLRHIDPGLGSILPGSEHRGTLVGRRETRHINCLELLAATLALKKFVKNKTGLNMLLRIDNTTVVAYIDNQGGMVSEELVHLTRDLWMWCLKRNIHIHAEHLPGCLNVVADRESRYMRDRSDWKLDSNVFMSINRRFGPLEVDLFASRLTHQCQRYFSWRPDPFAEATDAFLQDWLGLKGFANPPWNLIARVLAKTQSQRARIVLIAPVWKVQPWYPRLLLRKRFRNQQLSTQATELILKSWRTKTNKSYDSLGDSIAGVLDGVQIPFLVL